MFKGREVPGAVRTLSPAIIAPLCCLSLECCTEWPGGMVALVAMANMLVAMLVVGFAQCVTMSLRRGEFYRGMPAKLECRVPNRFAAEIPPGDRRRIPSPKHLSI